MTTEDTELKLTGSDPLGGAMIDPGPPIVFDGGTEIEIASAVARALDSLAELTKLLPIEPAAAARFRTAMFHAWTRLVSDASLCNADAGSYELEVADVG